MNNPNCDGPGPHSGRQVRRYPIGGGSNAILCRACVARENRYRAERRADTANPVDPAGFPHQDWQTLKVYE